MARKRIFKTLDSEMLDNVKENGIKEGLRWGGLRQVDKRELISSNPFVFSVENFGEDYLTPKGLPDGDTGRYDRDYVPTEDLEVCDIYGRPLSEEQFLTADFFCEIPGIEDEETNDAQGEELWTPSFFEEVMHKANTVESRHSLSKYYHLEEKYSVLRKRKNSPQFACANIDSPGSCHSRAEDRDNSGNNNYYKEKRKGGGRLSRGQSRKISMDIDSFFTHDLLCPPRVAIINGVSESFFVSRRKAHMKRLREVRQNKTCSRVKKQAPRRKKKIDFSLKNEKAWNVVMDESDRWSTRVHYYIFKNFSWQNGQAPGRINGYVYDVSEEKIAEKLNLMFKVTRDVGSEVVVGYKKSRFAKTIYYLRETTLPEGNVIRKI